jgi:hypothetical protein
MMPECRAKDKNCERERAHVQTTTKKDKNKT